MSSSQGRSGATTSWPRWRSTRSTRCQYQPTSPAPWINANAAIQSPRSLVMNRLAGQLNYQSDTPRSSGSTIAQAHVKVGDRDSVQSTGRLRSRRPEPQHGGGLPGMHRCGEPLQDLRRDAIRTYDAVPWHPLGCLALRRSIEPVYKLPERRAIGPTLRKLLVAKTLVRPVPPLCRSVSSATYESGPNRPNCRESRKAGNPSHARVSGCPQAPGEGLETLNFRINRPAPPTYRPAGMPCATRLSRIP